MGKRKWIVVYLSHDLKYNSIILNWKANWNEIQIKLSCNGTCDDIFAVLCFQLLYLPDYNGHTFLLAVTDGALLCTDLPVIVAGRLFLSAIQA